MEKFVVSARKYRPQGFDEVVGQEHITTTLKNAIDKDQLAQALLFCGPRGVGKTTCARIVSRLINNMEEGGEATSMNIFELDAASNNSVDDIRNLIDQVRYPPQYGKYKVYIIDEVHMLSNAAFNAFLKTLEEPPSYAIFILATTEKHKVIPTILSRCQIFDFNRIQISDMVGHLKNIADREDIKTEDEALHLIAQKADGALRDALSIFDLICTFSTDRSVTYQSTIDNLHILDYDYYFKITDYLVGNNTSQTLLIFNEILKQGFDGHQFINGLAEHFRNLLVARDAQTIELLEVPGNIKERYLKQAAEATPSFLLSALNITSQCDISYKNSKNQRLHVEVALLKMAHLNAAIKLAETSSMNGEVKKKNDELETLPDKEEKEKAPEAVADATINPVKTQSTEENVVKSPAQPAMPASKMIKRSRPSSTIKIPVGGALEVNEPEEKVIIKEESFGDQPFNEDDVFKAWESFAAKKKAEGKDSDYHVLQQKITLTDDKVIQISLINKLQEDIINKVRIDLMHHIRKILKNDNVQLKVVFEEKTEQRMLYTNKEKLEFLQEQKPIIKMLRDRLGLDPEF